jgi:hypothetical protein
MNISPRDVDYVLYSSNKPGSFLVRKPTKEIETASGLIQKYTLECFVGAENPQPLVKRPIFLTDEKKYAISTRVFSSLIELVYYYKRKPFYNDQVLTEPPNLTTAISSPDRKQSAPSKVFINLNYNFFLSYVSE